MKGNEFIKILLFLLFIFNSCIISQNNYKKNLPLKKQVFNNYAEDPEQSTIDLSNITCWVSNNGFHDWVVESLWNGAFPNGSHSGAIFSEGIVWGGLVNDGGDKIVRVNGNTYGSGCKAITRLYRVRPDYKTADLTRDAAAFFQKPIEEVTNNDIDKLRDQYRKDWWNWPCYEGALYKDVDGDGSYNPAVDIPGVPGAAQTIFIKYDDSRSMSNYLSPVIGLEVSETYWTYSNSEAFNNAVFKKVSIVYKGTPTSKPNSEIDSMYICQWSDTDLGIPYDDFSGCDTTLNLGYTYNSSNYDKVFSDLGMVPPAVGYVFLQGVSKYTGNINDSAIVNLKYRKGYKYVNPKPMSTFIFNGAGNTWSDPSFSYNGTLEFYNYLRGRMPIPRYPKGEKYPAAYGVTTYSGTYLLPGDPVAKTGILDGTLDGPGDRRMWLINGPFNMNLRDTAEVVIALVAGQGTSNLNSVTKLKNNVRTIKKIFNYSALNMAKAVTSPKVDVSPLHEKIILNWGKDFNLVNNIENYSYGTYKFEGYEVYQFPNEKSGIEEGIKIAQFDLKNGVTAIYDTLRDDYWVNIPVLKVRGKDNGITRFISITRDTLNKSDLIDGQTYYFGVVAYAYSKYPVPNSHIIRSPLKILKAIPQTANPGIRYNANFGDTLESIHVAGQGVGKILPIVVDPTKTNGKTYRIQLDTLKRKIIWSLKEKFTNKTIVSNQTNLSGDNNYPIVAGILTKVISSHKGIKNYSYTGLRWVSGFDWGGSTFFGGMDLGENFWEGTSPIFKYVPVELRFTGGNGKNIPSEKNGWAKGAVYRKDKNYEYAGIGWMPFTAWDISDSLHPRQINVSFVEDSANGSFNLKWDMGWEDNAFSALGGNEYIIISNTDYAPDYYNQNNNALKKDNMYFIWPKRRGSYPYLYGQFKMEIIPNKTLLPGDVYEYKLPNVTNDINLSKKDIEKINVFPNPHYTTATGNYVTFNHLPDNAMIRVFDLSGVLIRTIKHEKKNGQFERWNLVNDNNIYVASGIYIIHIDMPDLKKTKILKLAIVNKF